MLQTTASPRCIGRKPAPMICVRCFHRNRAAPASTDGFMGRAVFLEGCGLPTSWDGRKIVRIFFLIYFIQFSRTIRFM